MHLPRPDIFISATSADLAPMRDLVKRAILDLGAHPIEQEHFAPAGKTVAAMLREQIERSHALIHLVGACYGAEDETAPAAREHRTYAAGRRSYTQLEHDLAKELRKPVYIFICGENFPYRAHDPEPEEKHALQQEHRAQMLGGNVLFHAIERGEDLREQILRLEIRVRAVTAELQTTRTRLSRILAGTLLLAVLLGGVMFLLKERTESQARTIAAEQAAREQLEKQHAADEKRHEEDMKLVHEVLAKGENRPASAGAGGKSDGLLAAQVETAKERGLTLEELREKLAAAETGAAERVRLATEMKARATADIEQATQTQRAALQDLGDAALANLKYPEAVEHYRAAAALYDRAREPLPWAAAQAALGEALWRDGKYAASADLWQEVLAEREQHLGAEDRKTLTVMNNLALARQDAGDLAAAEPLYRRALAASDRVLGAEHPDTLTCVNNLAGLLDAKGDSTAAEPLYRRALEASERVLGAEHPATLISVNNLALLLKAKGEYAVAESLYRRALEASDRVLGAEHPDTLISVNNLAGLLDAKGDSAAAELLYRRALAAQERVLGAEHPATLISVNNLAVLLKTKGDFAAAEPLYRRALAARERVLGAEHPQTCLSAYNLAVFLKERGKKAEAVPLAWQAYRGWRKSKGAEHEDTRDARQLLIELGEKVEE